MRKVITTILALVIALSVITFVGCGGNGLQYKLNDEETGYIVTGFEDGKEKTENLEIPEKYKGLPVVGIGASAFKGKKSIKTVVLPNSLTNIGAMAFQGCTELATINTPESLTSMAKSVFKNCKKLEKFTIPVAMVEIPESTFEGSGIKVVPMHNALDKIGSKAFKGCEQLTELICGPKLRVIAPYAFAECSNLKNVDFGTNLKALEEHAFENCASIERLYIPKQLAHIYGFAFNGCSSLTFMEFQVNQNTWKAYMPADCRYTPWRNVGQGGASPSLKNMSMAPDLTNPELNPLHFIGPPPTPVSDKSDNRGKTRQDLGWNASHTEVLWEYAPSYDRYFFLCTVGGIDELTDPANQYWKGNY